VWSRGPDIIRSRSPAAAEIDVNGSQAEAHGALQGTFSGEGTAPTPEPIPLGRGFRTPLSHRLAEAAIAVMAIAAVAAIVLIFVFIGREALPLVWEAAASGELRLGDLLRPRTWVGYTEAAYVWQPVGTPPKYNIVPLFVGSLKVTALAMVVSVPLGVASAMYVALFAPRRLREVIKPAVELLAAVPSVVLGFFALMVLASWIQDAFGLTFRLNAIVAAIGLSLAVIPIVFTISEDALRAVPRTMSDAALALGARPYQTALRVIIPAALPGIAAAIVLGFGRAVGETMIVLMASGNAAVMAVLDPSTPVRTVTATVAAELGEVARGSSHWRVLFLLGVLLFAVTFVLNLLAAFGVRRLKHKLTAQP
jgi:phosphate transport system permease protein